MGHNRFSMRLQPIFRRFFVSYVIVLILPLIIGIVLYSRASDIVMRQSILLQQTMLEKTVAMMDQNISRSNELVLRFYFDEGIRGLSGVSGNSMKSSDIVAFLNAKKSINSYKVDNSFTNQFFIVFPESNVVLGKDIVNGNLEFFYENILRYEGMSYEEWMTELRKCTGKIVWPSKLVRKNDVYSNMVTYLQPLDSNSAVPKGIVFFLFDEKMLAEALSVKGEPDISVYILDKLNRPIYQKGEPIPGELIEKINASPTSTSGFFNEKFESGNRLAVYNVSELNGWKYVSFIPTHIALSELSAIKNITIVVTLITCIVGILAALFIAYKNSFPLHKVFQLLGESNALQSEEKPTLTALEDGVGNLVSTNRSMLVNYRQQATVLQALYVDRVLNGNGLLEDKDLEYCANNIEMFRIPGMWYCVLLVQVNNALTHMEGIKVLSEGILGRLGFFLHSHLPHILNDNELAIILCGEDELSLQKAANAYADGMRYYLEDESIPCIIGVGICVPSIRDIRESNRMALFAVQYAMSRKEAAPVVFSAAIASSDTFLYSPQVELQLIGNVKSSNAAAAEQILDDIYKRNFEENTLKPHMMKCLLYNLYCTFLKVSNSLSISAIDNDFVVLLEKNNGSYPAVFHKLRSALLRAANQYEDGKKSHNTSLIQNILQYLDENYDNPDLDVVCVADEFHIAEGYLSQFFKEQTGVNFLTYLINLRMGKAKELLAAATGNIADVAGMVGYRNVYSFRRAFKRTLGMAPSEYRDASLAESGVSAK
ncbi:AraC family transcriptional regulator [Ruminococcaceae bacterium OttesenSCG-928-L11]|nr:AraC family transcriptional regulator [Ruminococcaceae bacterium OttesenSCG-928-L11]